MTRSNRLRRLLVVSIERSTDELLHSLTKSTETEMDWLAVSMSYIPKVRIGSLRSSLRASNGFVMLPPFSSASSLSYVLDFNLLFTHPIYFLSFGKP